MERQPESAETSFRRRAVPLRILIVDDNEEIREYFCGIVTRYGITYDVAANGEEAVKLIEKGNFYDICFIDWMMPGMNGIELARRIKEIKAGKSVVIMISSIEWNKIEADAKLAGVDNFLSKPIFPSAIIDRINQCCGNEILKEVHKTGKGQTDCFEGFHVLLVEDVEINREIVVALLEPTLIKIDCAENGVEAVRMFCDAPEKYDIIFMDIQMPEMDGYEATHRIRAFEAEQAGESASQKESGGLSFTEGETQSYNRKLRSQIPIIAMTANVFHDDIERCMKAGMNAHVGKPLDFNEVLKILREYFQGNK